MTPTHSFSLQNILANRRWWKRSAPFPHVVAQNVFTESMYKSLEAAFQRCLAPDTNQFSRNMPGYDASGMEFTPDLSGPLSIFLSRPWHDLIAELIGVPATGDVVGSLHHHTVGSASGHPHNDLNPGWFADNPRADGVNVTDPTLCNYRNGKTYKDGVHPRETVRAVAVLFYLNNPLWLPGDGGETGLYHDGMDPVDKPAAVIPPINNSLLCFECTPYSYHSFITNRRSRRNSVTMWLHRPKAEVVSRWGEGKIVNWTQ